MRILPRRGLRDTVKQLRNNTFYAFKRVGNCARLFKNFLLHVMPIRPQLGGTTVGVHRFNRPLHRALLCVQHPVLTQLQVNAIALFEVNNLIGHAC